MLVTISKGAVDNCLNFKYKNIERDMYEWESVHVFIISLLSHRQKNKLQKALNDGESIKFWIIAKTV